MARWLWYLPFALLVLAVGLIGLRYGWLAATLTETDVINHYAARYLAEAGDGASVRDCVAYPGEEIPGVWLVVLCTPSDGAARAYYVNRLGGLEEGPAGMKEEGPRT